MSLCDVFNIAGSGMNAQSVRLNATASNLANAETVSSSAKDAYRARYPVFQSVYKDSMAELGDQSGVAVKIDRIIKSDAPITKQYDPNHSMADKDGYVYLPNVKPVDEMVNMMSASCTYQINVQVMNMTKQLMLRTLQLGQ